MPRLIWQKSSFSGGGEGECVELGASAPDRIRLRESDRPQETATLTPHALAALLRAVRAGHLSR